MTAVVCTCIRHERDARQIAVPDPDCGHDTYEADRDARHTATGLGLLITITLALGIALTAAALWPGTWAATTGLFVALEDEGVIDDGEVDL